MGKHTKRDEVWNAALQRAAKGESPKVKDIADCTSVSKSESVISETLDVMSDLGWLSKEGSHLYRWEPGAAFQSGETCSVE